MDVKPEKTKRPYSEMIKIAEDSKALLEPFCERIEIAGSLRRKCEMIGDIEFVIIPKPYETGLFESGIATVINNWIKMKGELEYGVCKYTQRMTPSGVKIDLFFAERENFGLQLAIRTGSAEYSHNVLARGWAERGYFSKEGYLYQYGNNTRFNTLEEKDLFQRIGVEYVEPEKRNL